MPTGPENLNWVSGPEPPMYQSGPVGGAGILPSYLGGGGGSMGTGGGAGGVQNDGSGAEPTVAAGSASVPKEPVQEAPPPSGGSPSTPAPSSSINMADYYTMNPGAVTVSGTAPQVSQSGVSGALSRAQAATGEAASGDLSGYNASTRNVTGNELASVRLNAITRRKSPLMQRAEQQGLLTAGARGLQNSSIAAGAAMGAMVDRATPLAQQEAQTFATQGLTNQAAVNRAREFTATAENTEAQMNASMQQEMEKMNAQLETAVSQGNAQEANKLRAQINDIRSRSNMMRAEMTNQRQLANMQAENQMRRDTLLANADINKQGLVGEQAEILEGIRGQYNTLISQNEAAANLYSGYFNSVNQMLGNDRITTDRVRQNLEILQRQLNAGLEFMQNIGGIDLSEFGG